MVEAVFEVLAWFGAFLILFAYFLLTRGKLRGKSVIYQSMNLVGSIFVGYNAWLKGAFPSLAINIVWVVIALWGIERFLEKHK